MKSLPSKLDGSEASIAAALAEAETFAYHCNLTQKQALHLRLLSEELLGMARGVLEVRSGDFWIEQDGPCFTLCLTARTQVGEQARARLLAASTSGGNDFYKGVSGKIRQALDWLSSAPVEGTAPPAGMGGGLMPSAHVPEWSLEQYRRSAQQDRMAQNWDELERSVLTKLADDIRVGVSSDQAAVTIYKTF